MVDRVQLKRRARELFRYTGCKRNTLRKGQWRVASLRHALQESSNNIATVPELLCRERRERPGSPRSSMPSEFSGTRILRSPFEVGEFSWNTRRQTDCDKFPTGTIRHITVLLLRMSRGDSRLVSCLVGNDIRRFRM